MDEPQPTYASPQDQVVSLETLRRDAVECGGGKGANLGELIAAGLPGSPGVCGSTAAYRRGVVEAGLVGAIEQTLKDFPTDDPASEGVASARITPLFGCLRL